MEQCIHSENCGGCLHQGVPYEEQLKIKEDQVKEVLEKRNIDCGEFVEIEAAPHIYSYRNKMDYTFGDEVIEGPMTLGMHKRKHFMSIVTVDHCQIVPEDFNTILKNTLEFANEKGYSFYHKKRHEGLLRHLVVRAGENTGQLLVNIVTTTQSEFDDDAFVSMINGLDTEYEVVGILRTIHDGVADFIYVDDMTTLWGQDYYQERLLDLDFKVSPHAFFQTNTMAIERLYKDAVSLMPKGRESTVFDVYCGTGTISLAISGYVKKVYGIELVAESVSSAKENALLNNIDNCEFLQGDAFEVMDSLDFKPDSIILDPPRVGLHPKAIKKILEYDLDEIIYVSCNPKTFAENMERFQENGYRLEYLKAYDNFPFTKHTELLTKIVKGRTNKF